MHLAIGRKVREDFPGLTVLTVTIRDIKVKDEDPHLESLKRKVVYEVKGKCKIESLKDLPSVRSYRDFLWKIKVDPTRSRPVAEALVRRILLGDELPKINIFVDSANVASVKSEVAIASFDVDKIHGELIIRYAIKGEEFGIGMKNPMVLKGEEVVIADGGGVIASHISLQRL